MEETAQSSKIGLSTASYNIPKGSFLHQISAINGAKRTTL